MTAIARPPTIAATAKPAHAATGRLEAKPLGSDRFVANGVAKRIRDLGNTLVVC
jgi:hypothetical protein